MVWPKVITLSGYRCIYEIKRLTQKKTGRGNASDSQDICFHVENSSRKKTKNKIYLLLSPISCFIATLALTTSSQQFCHSTIRIRNFEFKLFPFCEKCRADDENKIRHHWCLWGVMCANRRFLAEPYKKWVAVQ